MTSDLPRKSRDLRRPFGWNLLVTSHWSLVTLLLLSCQASTNRPPFDALPTAALAEIELPMPAATRTLAEALRADSLPVAKLEERDGFLDSGWFDAGSLLPTGRMPVGDDVVRIRAWATPTKAGFVELEVETVYRPLADPSRPDRDLEMSVPSEHPVQRRVSAVLRRLLVQYGDTTRDFTPLPAPGRARPDTARRDTLATRRDTSGVRRDTTLPRRDTTFLLPPR